MAFLQLTQVRFRQSICIDDDQFILINVFFKKTGSIRRQKTVSI